MKKLTLLILLFGVFVYSQDYDLNINLKDGSTATFSVDDIQRLEFDNITSIKDVKQLLESFKVFQNYPNPFNPSTTITYQIPNTSNVILRIYDINGQLVKELLNETLAEGEYHVTWNGKNEKNMIVGSGVYIYTVSADKQIVSKQMILLK